MLRKKVLVIGGLRDDEFIGCIGRGFHANRCEVHHIGMRMEERNHGMDGAQEALLNRIDELKPDYIFTWKGHFIMPETAKKMQALDIPLIYWSFDDPFYTDHWKGNDHACLYHNYVFTCCEGTVKDYKDRGIKEAFYLPPACDPVIHRTFDELKLKEYEFDVMLAGTNLYPKDKYPDVLIERLKVFRRLISMGLKLKVWGLKDPIVIKELGDVCHERIIFEDLAYAYHSAKICLNSHVRPDGYRYLNERVMELLGCGAFQLCDRVNGIEGLFKEGKEIAYYSTEDELIEKVEYYLKHDEEREAIKLQGRKKALKFNYKDFAKIILDVVEGKGYRHPFEV